MSSSDSSVLPENYSSGPLGLGDPNDKSLRKVENEIMIPKMMRQMAKSEKCTQFVKDFEECCKNASFFMVIKCRTQNNRLKGCLSEWYNNQQFRDYVTQLYLDERAEYRRTGVQKKFKRM